MGEKLGGTAVIRNTSTEFLLEYYLVGGKEKNYGVKIEKKEKNKGEFVLSEKYTSQYIIGDKDSASKVLDILVKNSVTPTTVDCVLHDLGYFEN